MAKNSKLLLIQDWSKIKNYTYKVVMSMSKDFLK